MFKYYAKSVLQKKDLAMSRIDNPLEKRLAEFAADKSRENYVRLLYAFRYTDVLVPSALPDEGELPFANGGFLPSVRFKPFVVFFPTLNRRLIPVFSTQKQIPADFKAGKASFMHCRDWINAAKLRPNDGVILNPYSERSFVLTKDQIQILASFPEDRSF